MIGLLANLDGNKKVRVFLLLLGLNRSLSYTSESIVRELVRPLERSKSTKFMAQLFLIQPAERFISNAWSREEGPLEAEIPESLRGVFAAILEQSELERRVLPVASELSSIADTWSDKGQSILNSLVFLQALSVARQSIPSDADVVIFARPDTRIERGLRVVRHVRSCEESRIRKTPKSLFPSWHSFGGLNDRFAIVPREHIDRYFRRVDRLPELLAQDLPYHSERFLFSSYRGASYDESIETTMVRIRIGGRPEQSDVELVKRRKWYRRRTKAIWKHRVSPALRVLFRLH